MNVRDRLARRLQEKKYNKDLSKISYLIIFTYHKLMVEELRKGYWEVVFGSVKAFEKAAHLDPFPLSGKNTAHSVPGICFINTENNPQAMVILNHQKCYLSEFNTVSFDTEMFLVIRYVDKNDDKILKSLVIPRKIKMPVSTASHLSEYDNSAISRQMNRCGNNDCDKIADKWLVCSKCQRVNYCSKECQIECWDSHKKFCKKCKM